MISISGVGVYECDFGPFEHAQKGHHALGYLRIRWFSAGKGWV